MFKTSSKIRALCPKCCVQHINTSIYESQEVDLLYNSCNRCFQCFVPKPLCDYVTLSLRLLESVILHSISSAENIGQSLSKVFILSSVVFLTVVLLS
jgi:hypothetical protein